MTIPPPDTGVSLTMRRTLNAPREKVFNAWIDAEAMTRWFRPGGKAPVVSLDVRVGGVYRIDIIQGDGSAVPVTGKYVEIVRPEKLVFTWMWVNDSEQREMLITVEFHEHDEGTELVLRHDRLANQESADSHRMGWDACLNGLVPLLEEA